MSKVRRWVLRVLAGMFCTLVLLVLLGVLLAARWRHIPLRVTTTRITAPLAKDGLPDYLKAINDEYGKGVTAENNAAPGVLAVLGLRADTPAAWRDTELRLLKMPDPGTGTLETYANWLTAKQKAAAAASGPASEPAAPVDEFAADDVVRDASQALWTRAEHPELAAYLDAQGPALDQLETALQRDRLFIPNVTPEGDAETVKRLSVMVTLLPSLSRFREGSTDLAARAMLRLAEGDTAGFEHDVLCDLKFSRLVVQQPSLIGYLVAAAIRSQALRAVQSAAVSGKLDARTAADLREKLAAEGAWPTPAHNIDVAERYSLLDAVCGLATGGTMPGVSGGTAKIPMVPINFPHALEEANGLYDRMRDAFGEKHYADMLRELDAVETEVGRFATGGPLYKATHISELLVAILIPATSRVATLYENTVVDGRLANAALALRIYRAGHQAYPDALADAGISGEAATDPFTDKPLVYRKEAGGYVLYSVGEDLTDDGGKVWNMRGKRAGTDLVIKASE